MIAMDFLEALDVYLLIFRAGIFAMLAATLLGVAWIVRMQVRLLRQQLGPSINEQAAVLNDWPPALVHRLVTIHRNHTYARFTLVFCALAGMASLGVWMLVSLWPLTERGPVPNIQVPMGMVTLALVSLWTVVTIWNKRRTANLASATTPQRDVHLINYFHSRIETTAPITLFLIACTGFMNVSDLFDLPFAVIVSIIVTVMIIAFAVLILSVRQPERWASPPSPEEWVAQYKAQERGFPPPLATMRDPRP